MHAKLFIFGISIPFLLGAYSPKTVISETKYITQIENNKALYTIPTNRPFPELRISSGFNLKRLHPIFRVFKPHTGVDIPLKVNTPIKAVGNGKIITAKYSQGYGYHIDILHGIDSSEKLIVTRYAHLNTICYSIGTFVTKGDIIALSGNTGHSTSPHLHFEVLVNNIAVNSDKYFKA